MSDEDIVQPDLLVVCDPNQIKETHIEGAAKLVVEIVSPSSESRDRLLKMKLNLAEVFDLPYSEEEMKIFEVKESPAKYMQNR